ncbi:hypothetical protein Tco_0599617 [Tanacetum coccineum]
MRQTIDSLLSKTINELTNQSSDYETFCPREIINELELRMQRRNNFEEELFKDMFPTEEELAYHKGLLGLGQVIDGRLSEVVLEKPFVQTSKLTYDESLRLIRFAHRDDEVVFRMPQRTKELDLISPLEKDKFEAFFVENLKVEKLICLRTSKSQVYGYLMRFLALGWHLEEIRVTWDHLEKKRTRLRLYTKNHEEFRIQRVETASGSSS